MVTTINLGVMTPSMTVMHIGQIVTSELETDQGVGIRDILEC